MSDSCKGCRAEVPAAVEVKTITEILERYGHRVDALIMILQDIQNIYRYLPEDALRVVTEMLEVPFSQVYEVATFYRSFSLEPRGAHEIRVCLGTACHLRGGPRILENFERELGISAGGTTQDGTFTLETVNCVGACALAPLVLVDTEYFGNNNSSSVKRILKKYSDR
jgi:NADH:ubiquinone oxidoreductase subunit E